MLPSYWTARTWDHVCEATPNELRRNLGGEPGLGEGRMKRATNRRYRLAAVLAATALIAAACGGDDVASGDVLEPMADGFPNETITIVVVDDPGSYDALYIRDLAEAAAQFSPVDFNVVLRNNFGSFGTYEAIVWMQDQPGGTEGYVLAMAKEPGISTDLIGQPVVAELGADLDWMQYIIGTEQSPLILYTANDRPWGNSFEAFIEYAKANPLVYAGGGGDSGRDIGMASIAQIAGFEYEEIAGGARTEIAAAVIAGLADFAIVETAEIPQFFEDGQITALAATQEGQELEFFGSPPRTYEVIGGDPDPWGTLSGVYAPETVSPERVAWFYDLFSRAAASEEFKAKRAVLVPGIRHLENFGASELRAYTENAYVLAYRAMRQNGLVAPGAEVPLVPVD